MLLFMVILFFSLSVCIYILWRSCNQFLIFSTEQLPCESHQTALGPQHHECERQLLCMHRLWNLGQRRALLHPRVFYYLFQNTCKTIDYEDITISSNHKQSNNFFYFMQMQIMKIFSHSSEILNKYTVGSFDSLIKRLIKCISKALT